MRQRVHCRSLGTGTPLSISKRKPARLGELLQSDARIGTSTEPASCHALDLRAQRIVSFHLRFRPGALHQSELSALLPVLGFPSDQDNDVDVVISAPISALFPHKPALAALAALASLYRRFGPRVPAMAH